ncbi:MAG: alcohol dehydrogenase catalytic domain-containing protein [Chloroflexi bacterium]|nr:alcohol dehydrogenase catalytic domain-containing protein [Chloroflexota bacterium]MBU1748558.1 alcohol dehydrogenase catalytic domain-containing protein [Chloroflexota bacterium]MBU1878570.1 alcohol dehydrogenase catalytic domain-containing protein [Chloroflexota bacterium]
MKALVFDGHHLRLEYNHPDPVPAGDEALVRVRLAGICNTDVEIMRGYRGFTGVLGHEFVGTVEHCADPRLIGQRVVGEISCSCGECETCRAGRYTHCPQRTTLGIIGRDGALGEWLVLPMRNLHRVPPGVPDEAAVFTEPLAAAIEVLEQVHLHPTDRVYVVGDGKLGLLVAQVLSLTGCEIASVGRHPEKLALLQARGIATILANQTADLDRSADVACQVADVVVDCTGHPAGFELARRLLRPRGTLVLKSTFASRRGVALTPLVVDEIKLVGSRCGPFAPALRLLRRELVDVRSLITATYPIDDGLAAFRRARKKGTLKVLVSMV